MRYTRLRLLLIIIGFTACTTAEEPLFRMVSSKQSGLTFTNIIEESDTLDPVLHTNMYNGAGVATADLNQDQLPDIILAGNMVPTQLFLNRGNLQFEEVTQKAGLLNQHWNTGISLVDLNLDGCLDIYLSCSITPSPGGRKNLLYLSKSCESGEIPVFHEMAEEAGLADTFFTTQTVFLDYDKDGDMDAYCLSNATEPFPHNTIRPKKKDGRGLSNDHFYRNEGLNQAGIPQFVEVSQEAGIQIEGYGLGVAVHDFNADGWPDIYVANDFITNDLMWINQKDGTFRNEIGQYLKHQSHNGMGVDIADIDQNGHADIIVLDMLPENNRELKLMMADNNYDRHNMTVNRLKYEPQFMRNTLQLNMGAGIFSEVGQMSGIHNTHWSWAPLIADLDNDGLRDILITNGYPKNVIDLDYIHFLGTTGMFGSPEAVREKQAERVANLAEIKVPNYIFRNEGETQFTDVSENWGMTMPSVSNGAAYGDLDLDGDLDLIIHNINQEVFLYENLTQQKNGYSYLKLSFEGDSLNPDGFGARVTIWAAGQCQTYFHEPVRGFQSFVEPIAHFGLGEAQLIDSLDVLWADGKSQKLRAVLVNQHHKLSHKNAQNISKKPKEIITYLQQQPFDKRPHFQHQESPYVDFRQSPLLPHQHTREGPGVAVADVNGDGLEDLYVGGAFGNNGQLLLQKRNGSFIESKIDIPPELEETGVLFFDADNDGDPDLYIVSGGTEHRKKSPNYQDRLYFNNGQGQFIYQPEALPEIESSGSCVTATDYDRDGDLDLFVGGRISPENYPLPPRSYLLQNQGGQFVDVTTEIIDEGYEIGMVTTALWTDYDQDGWIDLLVAGEWMPITFLKNNEGNGLIRDSIHTLTRTHGWWNSLIGLDFDRDGDMDYIAGNQGTNNPYNISPQTPLHLFAKDYDKNETIDPVMAHFIEGKLESSHPRDALTKQIVAMKKRFPSYQSYAEANLDGILTPNEREDAYILQLYWCQTSLIENLGDGNFEIRPLPWQAQIAPVNGLLSTDLNGDANPDLVMVGNDFSAEIGIGPYDAFSGLILLGDGAGNFQPLSPAEGGMRVNGDARALVRCFSAQNPLFIISQNNDSLISYSPYPQLETGEIFSPESLDAFVIIYFTDGSTQRHECTYGDGYLSQSSRKVSIPSGAIRLEVINSLGEKRTISLSDLP